MSEIELFNAIPKLDANSSYVNSSELADIVDLNEVLSSP
jgi:hypothetical protein